MGTRKEKRGRKPATDSERKSRIIQTRVDKDLEKTLKKTAEKKRMTVSHLIRFVLEDTFNLVDGIVSDSSALVENVKRDARRIAASARGATPTGETPIGNPSEAAASSDNVDAWQDVIVNKPSQCIDCNITIPRGQRAYRGLSTALNVAPVWLCTNCIQNL